MHNRSLSAGQKPPPSTRGEPARDGTLVPWRSAAPHTATNPRLRSRAAAVSRVSFLWLPLPSFQSLVERPGRVSSCDSLGHTSILVDTFQYSEVARDYGLGADGSTTGVGSAGGQQGSVSVGGGGQEGFHAAAADGAAASRRLVFHQSHCHHRHHRHLDLLLLLQLQASGRAKSSRQWLGRSESANALRPGG